METGTLVSLSAYFILMLGIGVYAWRKSTADSEGYLLGGRDLGPAVTALSAGASDMSGWLLMGLPGAIFLSGLSQAWIAVGLVIGAYLNYRLVAPRLRTYTELANDAITVPDFLEERFEDKSHTLRLMSALVIIVFFTLYTSAGMVAGGKFAVSAMGMDYTTGILLMGGIVVAYTALGGFLAVSLTDFVQGCIMFLALVMVPVAAWLVLGSDGISSGIAAAEAIARAVADVDDRWRRDAADDHFRGGVGTWLFRPAAHHRPLHGHPPDRGHADRAADQHRLDERQPGRARLRPAMSARHGSRRAAARPRMPRRCSSCSSQILFHPLVAGFTLAAILAAIMSTISSQLLVTSSSLTEDVYKNYFRREASERELVTVGRLSVALVSIVAGVLALDPENSILGLVGNAWAGFGAAFGPVILFSLLWKRTTRSGALAGMVVGAVTVVAWIVSGLGATLYEIVPGFAAASLATWLVSLATEAPSERVEATFEAAALAAQPGS